jgi:hypothetical protein
MRLRTVSILIRCILKWRAPTEIVKRIILWVPIQMATFETGLAPSHECLQKKGMYESHFSTITVEGNHPITVWIQALS